MGERYSIVGICTDGQRTSLLANIGEAEAKYIARSMRTLNEFERIEIVAEKPLATVSVPEQGAGHGPDRWPPRFDPEPCLNTPERS